MNLTRTKQEEAKFSSTVLSCAAALHIFDNKEHLLEYALESVLSLTRSHAGSILIWDDTAKELVVKTAKGPYREKSTNARVKLKQGIAGYVADQGSSILVKNIHQDTRFRQSERLGNYRSDSFISIPMLAGNKLLGVVNITERECHTAFDEDDLEKAAIFVRHLAIAYANLKIESRLRAENERLTKTIEQLNENARQLESLASVGRLVSNLAHELNNPLDGIRRFLNLALDHVMDDSIAREYLLKAKGGIRRSIQVIRGLLAFSRETNQRHAKRISEIHEVIEESIKMVCFNPAYAGVKFERDFCLLSLYVQHSGLWSVFKNLFDNAHHAMKGDGVITIGSHYQNGQVVITIRDTGCGIPEEHKTRLFEPFFTTKESEGTGIGLALSQDIVHRSGGRITFDSTKDRGTVFSIILPCELRKATA